MDGHCVNPRVRFRLHIRIIEIKAVRRFWPTREYVGNQVYDVVQIDLNSAIGVAISDVRLRRGATRENVIDEIDDIIHINCNIIVNITTSDRQQSAISILSPSRFRNLLLRYLILRTAPALKSNE